MTALTVTKIDAGSYRRLAIPMSQHSDQKFARFKVKFWQFLENSCTGNGFARYRNCFVVTKTAYLN